jgi:hypothetical protein
VECGKYNSKKRTDEERAALISHSDRYGIRATSEKFGVSVYAIKEIRKRNHQKLSGKLPAKRRRPEVKPVRSNEYRSVDESSCEEYRSRALNYGLKKSLNLEEAQDFAAFAVIGYLEYGPKNYSYVFSDFCREKYGRDRTELREETEARKALHHGVELDHKLVAKEEGKEVIEFPKSVDGMIAQLVFKYGFKQKEIGEMLGLHESAISLRLNYVIDYLRGRYGSTKRTAKAI